VLQHGPKIIFGTILGILLLQASGSALAFTLISLPEELTPSTTITNSMTLTTQIQPVTGAIKARLFSAKRANKSKKMAQYGNMLAANSYVDSISDVDHMMLAYNDLASNGKSGGSSGGDAKSLWITSSYSSLKNSLTQTRFDGDVHILLAGYDRTLSEKYIFGVALSHETSNFNTRFNSGDAKTRGFNISPYVAVLLSDSWSFDLSLGHGKFNTDQSRAMIVTGPVLAVIDSDFSSTRDFLSTNLTGISALGDWNLTGSVGIFAAKQKQDAYAEIGGFSVDASSQTIKQWNLAGEAAYVHRDSESYLGLMYEKDTNPDELDLPGSAAAGEQPGSDADSYLLTAGWRHFGKDLTANFAFTSRRGQSKITDNGFSVTIRTDF
jgi:hypothetical protein